MGRRHILAALVALLALVVAGCGGGGDRLSKSQYESKVGSISTEVSKNLNGIGQQKPTSPAQIDSYVTKAQTALNHAADELGALKPPKNAEADNQKLATAVRFFAKSLDQLKQAAKSKSKAALQSFYTSLLSSKELRDAQTASADLKKKGYKVGGFGG